MQPNPDQYGFIMNPDGDQKRARLSPTAKFSKKQLALFGGAALIILAIAATLLLSLFNSGPSNKDHLISVASQQAEIIQLSEIAIKDVNGAQAKNLAQTTRLSLRSDQSSLNAVLKAQRVKVPKAPKTSENISALTEAQQNNRLDVVYLEIIQKELAEYQQKLETAYKTSVDSNLREAMKLQYQNASLIIGVDPEV